MSKRADEAIERVLTGLREAEAPEGMERRILEAMRERAASASVWERGRAIWPAATVRAGATRAWAWGFGLAAVLAMVSLEAYRVHRIGHESAASTTHPVSVEARSPVAQAAVANGTYAQPVVSLARAAGPAESATGAKGSATGAKGSDARREELLSDSDLLALSEMHAESLAAPELPLT